MKRLTLQEFILAALFTSLTAIGSYLIIPLPISPVPITLQTFFVLMSGLIGGKYIGITSQLTYFFIGIIGLPVFASGLGGIGVLLSPTGGFLIAFPLAAYIAGIKKNLTDSKYLLIKLIFANLIIYLIGITYMIIGWDFNLKSALTAGVLPFIPGDLLKIILLIIIKKKIKNINYF
ncbi:MAG: biotin transporter BioY [Bacillota bacterium]